MNKNLIANAVRDMTDEEKARRTQEVETLFKEIDERTKTIHPQTWDEIADEVRKRAREKNEVQLGIIDRIKLKMLKSKLKLTKKEEKVFDYIYKHTTDYIDEIAFVFWGLISLAAGAIGAAVTKGAKTGWTIKQWERDQKYFNDHPEMLEKAKEILQTDDINAIIGYVNGSDGAAKELYYSLGLQDYYFNANIAGLEVGAAVFATLVALPIASCLANAGSCKMSNHLEYKAEKTEEKIDKIKNTGIEELMEPVMKMKKRVSNMKWHGGYDKRPDQEIINNDIAEVCQVLKI